MVATTWCEALPSAEILQLTKGAIQGGLPGISGFRIEIGNFEYHLDVSGDGACYHMMNYIKLNFGRAKVAINLFLNLPRRNIWACL